MAFIIAAGINYQGQLGANLSADYSYTPVEVAGNHTFQSMSCGMDHTCALEPPPTSQAWCWGVSWVVCLELCLPPLFVFTGLPRLCAAW